MECEYDEAKRSLVLNTRGLDIAEAREVFDGFFLQRFDEKHSDEEDRYIAIGIMHGEVVIVIWTPRNGRRRIVTMWKADEREARAYFRQRDRGG